jgi:Icc protein
LPRSFTLRGYRFLLLNSLARWKPGEFGLGGEQMQWLQEELSAAKGAVVFMHAYPSEHGQDASRLRELFQKNDVLLVEMGHTHYNELANDGHTIYAATRSTGQIEEGPAGFSVTSIDEGVVSWKFKPLGEWPLVMITSPADERLIINPDDSQQVIRGALQVRARAWGECIESVTISIDGAAAISMNALGDGVWSRTWTAGSFPDGSHTVTVEAKCSDGRSTSDRIMMLVQRHGDYTAPARHHVDYENVVGAWPEKHILGTQLGPNENGHPW